MTYTLQERIIDLAKRSNSEKEFAQHIRAITMEYEVETVALEPSKTLSNLYSTNVDELTSAKSKNIISTGYKEIDENASFYFSELVVIGGRPSMGKTQFLINLCLNFAVNYKVLYFNLESSISNIANRFCSVLNEIPLTKLLKRNLSKEELEKINANASSQLLNNIFLNDNLQTKIGPLLLEAERMIKEEGVQIIVVDYLQLLQATRYQRNREMEVAYVLMSLKELALKHHVSVIIASQLSRAVETRGGTKVPMLSDLRESGAIEQDADKVMFLYRPEYYGFDIDMDGEPTKGSLDLILAKNRSGTVMNFPMQVDQDFIKISSRVDPYSQQYIQIDPSRLDEL